MAIEIKELHLKFNVEGQASSEDDSSSNSAGKCSDSGKVNKSKIIQECVEQVLRVLEEKEENR
jgi:hypothetical protein